MTRARPRIAPNSRFGVLAPTATSLATGWVGMYNFRFDLGGVPVYFDDALLSESTPTATVRQTWGELKARYR